MTKPTGYRKTGMALATVLLLVFCTFILAVAMFNFRKETKKQNVKNISFVQANFLAHAAIQHALLKINLLPQEVYDAGVLQQGYCPFQAITKDTPPQGGQSTCLALEIFSGDMNSRAVPWKLRDFPAADWGYEVASFVVIAAFTDKKNKELVQTVQITATGIVTEQIGDRAIHNERIVKTVEIRRPQ